MARRVTERLIDEDEGLLQRLGGLVLELGLVREELGQVLDDELGGLLPLLAVAWRGAGRAAPRAGCCGVEAGTAR
eukprot:scaffold54942_cov75-Phaeocystis_antarctica.AAC.2